MGLAQEATSLLQQLIRHNTVNPPGNERAAQELLSAQLEEAGFECELIGVESARPNLIARLAGRSDGPRLCLLGHVDTVLADAEEWTVDPWSGELRDGYLWGRGALDMKGQVACEVAAACELGRSGWRPESGELMVIVTCDEEAGATIGAKWLCEQVPDKVRCDMIVNEGAGEVLDFGDRRFYTVVVGEKGVFRFKLTTEGRAGHASMPHIGDNALLRMVDVLARLDGRQPPFDDYPAGKAPLEALVGDAGGLEDALDRVRAVDPRVADQLRADAPCDDRPDDDPSVGEGKRDPLALHGAGRLPRAAGHGSGARAPARGGSARLRGRERLPVRVHAMTSSATARRWADRSPTHCATSPNAPIQVRRCYRSCYPDSRTVIGSEKHFPNASRMVSSRSVQCRSSRQRR